MLAIPFMVIYYLALLIILTLLFVLAFNIFFPISVLYYLSRIICCCDGRAKFMVVVLCSPCLYFKGLIYEIPKELFQINILSTLLSTIQKYIIRVKHLFYTVNPYKENLFNYKHMKVNNSGRRMVYFVLMLMLIVVPVIPVLAIAYFIVSAVVVLIFTLTCFPFIAWKEKSIPLWVIIVFFPVVLLSYLLH